MRQARAEAEQSVSDENTQQEGEGAATADQKKALRATSRN
jgi:magnesium chelatase subunit I